MRWNRRLCNSRWRRRLASVCFWSRILCFLPPDGRMVARCPWTRLVRRVVSTWSNRTGPSWWPGPRPGTWGSPVRLGSAAGREPIVHGRSQGPVRRWLRPGCSRMRPGVRPARRRSRRRDPGRRLPVRRRNSWSLRSCHGPRNSASPGSRSAVGCRADGRPAGCAAARGTVGFFPGRRDAGDRWVGGRPDGPFQLRSCWGSRGMRRIRAPPEAGWRRDATRSTISGWSSTPSTRWGLWRVPNYT